MAFKKLPSVATVADLTPQQADFVMAYVELGGQEGSAVEAALLAGYGRGIRKNAEGVARHLLKNPRVLSAIKSALSNEFVVGAVLGLKTLIELCGPKHPSTVRLAAAKDLLDRGVGPVVSRSAHVHAEMAIEDFLAILDAEETGQPPALDTECVEVAEPVRSLRT